MSAEPSGDVEPARTSHLRFVIQKHAASHLHFDLRLELDSVMKSWAIPKGPSTDPSVKRLAMQVEDHPLDYNTFEGTIPKGEYGGGTVMLWDRGTYAPDKPVDDDEATVREGYSRGDLKITFFGERIRGSYALIRMKSRDTQSSAKPQWLLIKHRDEFASTDDVVADNMTSFDSGRIMEEIASGESKVWQSNRKPSRAKSPKTDIAMKKGALRSRARRRVYAERTLVPSTSAAAVEGSRGSGAPRAAELAKIIKSLEQLEKDGGSGAIQVEGRELTVTNLNKVF